MKNISISESDIEQISYYNNDFIIGKSDSKNDFFDVLIFGKKDIQKVTIPKFIRRIASYAFDGCNQLKIVDFSKKSELVIIGKNSFSNTSISTIFLTTHVEKIGNRCFYNCSSLKKVEFGIHTRFKTSNN